VLGEEPILEVVDDILIGAHLEETPGIGPQGLIHLLLHLGQIMASARSDLGSLEVVDESSLEVLPRVDRVWLEAFKPGEGCGL
jgi:hypothetical protein